MNKTVVVVEDNALNMKLTCSLLSLLDCRILEAGDAETGLEMIREQKPDLVLMDIQLPGMDGFEACRMIREDFDKETLPVIAVTALATGADEIRALEAGCNDFIPKPIKVKVFLEKVADYIGVPQEQRIPVLDRREGVKKKVLVVDDAKTNVKQIKEMLPPDLYEVLEAYNGIDALKIARNEIPDVIFLDIIMPDIDGYEVTRRLKADSNTKDIPIVMVTALDGSDDRVKGLEAGAEDVLAKPVNRVEVIARTRSMIRLREFQTQLSIRDQAAEHFAKPASGCSAQEKKDNPTVLLVEDNEQDLDLFKCYLEGSRYRVHVARSGQEALDILERRHIDLVLLDILLPDMDGFQVFSRMKNSDLTKDVPVIIVTALSDLENKVKGINLGVDDYLIKPIDSREVNARIEVLLKKKSYIERLTLEYQAAMNSAVKDGLTGLYNHEYFMKFLDLELKRARRFQYPVSLAMIDIDNFRDYNKMFGHLVGNVVIREVAEILISSFREIDLVARYGGDEFSVVLPYCGEEEFSRITERVQKQMAAHSFAGGNGRNSVSVSVSIGYAGFPLSAQTPEELIAKADSMLLTKKGDRSEGNGEHLPGESGKGCSSNRETGPVEA